MKKIVKIGDKEYTMQSSAFTQFAYKNETGRSFLSDVKELATKYSNVKNEEFQLDDFDFINELLLKIAFVMIQEADSGQAINFETFLKGIDGLYDNQEWINETIELACSPISRQLQTNK